MSHVSPGHHLLLTLYMIFMLVVYFAVLLALL
jgi:hypothetical protein